MAAKKMVSMMEESTAAMMMRSVLQHQPTAVHKTMITTTKESAPWTKTKHVVSCHQIVSHRQVI